MATFVPIEEDASFSVTGSNQNLAASFSSTLKEVYLKMYGSENSNLAYVLGVSNITESVPKFMIGKVTSSSSNVAPVSDFVLQEGNVGVGVQTPSQKLDIAGGVNFIGSIYQNGSLFISSDNSNVIVPNRLGVGTNAPLATAHFQGNVLVGGAITPSANETYDLGSDTQRFKDIYLSGNSIHLGQTKISSNAANVVSFRDAINSTFQDIHAKNIVAEGTISATNLAASAFTDTTNATNITTGTINNARLPSTISVATFSGDGSSLSNLNATLITSGSLANARLPPAFNVSTATETIVVNSTGVGIGASPQAKLHVAGDILATGTMTASNLVVLGETVTLNTVTSNTENMVINNAGSGPALKVIQSGANVVAEFYDAENVAPALFIADGGNVGIGTGDPLQKLHVVGNAYVFGSMSATTVSGSGSDLTNLNASAVTSGTLDNARLPSSINVATFSGDGSSLSNLNAILITSGTLNNARLPSSINVATISANGASLSNLNATLITSGTLDNSRLPSTISVGTVSADGSSLSNLNASLITNGTLNNARLPSDISVVSVSGSGSSLSNLNASYITSGTVDNARLPASINVATLSGDGSTLSNLNATLIQFGTLDNSRLPASINVATLSGEGSTLSNLNATLISTGTLNNDRLPSNIVVASFTGSGASLSNLNASYITTGTLDNARLPAAVNVATLSGEGSSLSNLNATYIASGTIDNARLPTSISVSTLSGDGASLSNLNATLLTSGTLGNARLPTAFNVSTVSETIVVNATGVGVGIVPQSKLHVDGDVLTTGTLTTSNLIVLGDTVTLNTVTSNTENMVINNAGSGPALKVLQSGANVVAEFYDAENVAPALYIADGGNVGMGTDNPIVKLQVVGNVAATEFSGSGASLTSLNASQITSGTIDASRLPPLAGDGSSLSNLNASYITSGTIDNARLPSSINVATFSGDGSSLSNLNASLITSGTIDNVRLPSSINVATFSGDGSSLSNLNASLITSGTLTNSRLPSNVSVATISADGASLSNLNATLITSGTLSADRLSLSGANAGSYGTVSTVPVLTVDDKGRVTSVTTSNIAITASAVSGLAPVATTNDYNSLSNITFVLSGTDATYTSGNVGIGVTNASSKLHVAGDILSTGTMTASNLVILGDTVTLNTVTSNTENMVINNAGSGTALVVRQTGTTDVARFMDDDNVALLIADGGLVGINTAAPQYPLHVQGDAGVSGTLYTQAVVGSGTSLSNLNASLISVGTLGNARLPSAINVATLSGDGASLSNLNATYLVSGTLNRARLPTAFNVLTDTQTLTLNNSGSVGVGTATPTHKLHVDGALRVNNWQIYTNGNRWVSDNVSANGNAEYWFNSVNNNNANNINIRFYATTTNTGNTTGNSVEIGAWGMQGGTQLGYQKLVLNGAGGLGQVGVATFPNYTLDVGGTTNTPTLRTNTITSAGQNIDISGKTLSNVTAIVTGSLSGSGASLSNLNATLITSGTLANARLPTAISVGTVSADGSSLSNLNATFITAGTLANERLPANIAVATFAGDGASLSNLNATLMTSGTLNNARLPSAINVATFSGDGASLSNLNASLITSGTLDSARLPSSYTGDGASLSNLNATLITSGTLDNARLPSSISVAALSGDGVSLSNLNATLITSGTLNSARLPSSGVVAATYGSASETSVITTDTYGRITSASSQQIVIGAASVTGLASVATSGDYNSLSNITFVLTGTTATYTNGNVGIGTNVSLNTFEVKGSTALGSYAGEFAAPTNGLIISGNVGLGVPNPASKLHVGGDIISSGTITASNLIVLGDTVTLNTTTSNTENLVITNAGSGPALQVVQTGAEPIARFIDDTTVALIIADGGFVGINTSVPSQMLHVVGNALVTGTVSASNLTGSGATLSNLNATLITTGTLDNGRLPSSIAVTTLSGDGVSLSNLNATLITSGTLANARLPSAISATTFSGDGSSLSNLNATLVASGTLDNARLPTAIAVTSVSADGASLSNLNATLITSGTLDNARLPTAISVATLSGDGTSLSNLNATLITSGTLNNARLPTSINVATISGDGASLSNLNATLITSGTLANARLPVAFDVNASSTSITISALNNVGIGTTQPLQKLHVQGNVLVNGDVIPTLSNTFNLGSSNARWKDVYLSGNTIDMDGTRLTRDGTGALQVVNSNNAYLGIKAGSLYTSGSIGIGVTSTTDALSITNSSYSNALAVNSITDYTLLDKSGTYPSLSNVGTTATSLLGPTTGVGSYYYGANNYTVFPASSAIAPSNIFTNSFTIQMWVYAISESDVEIPYHIGGIDMGLGGNKWSFGVNSLNRLSFFYTVDGIEGTKINGGTTIPLATWTHIAVTYNVANRNLSMYINGVPENVSIQYGTATTVNATTVAVPTIASYTITTVIGAWQNYRLDSYISELSFVIGSVVTPSLVLPQTLSVNTKLLLVADPVLNKFVVSRAGKIGIGFTNATEPTYSLHVLGDTCADNIIAQSSYGFSNDTNTGVFHPASSTLSIQVNGSESVRFASTGNIGIGTTTPNYKLHVQGKIFAADSITAYSDARVKTDVATITDALNIVSRLRGVEYTRSDTGEKQLGVIAQEVQQVIPRVVTEANNGLSVAYGNMVGVLIEAIKELTERVKYLESR